MNVVKLLLEKRASPDMICSTREPGASHVTLRFHPGDRLPLSKSVTLRVGDESISCEWTADSEAEQTLHALQAQKGSPGLLEVPWRKEDLVPAPVP